MTLNVYIHHVQKNQITIITLNLMCHWNPKRYMHVQCMSWCQCTGCIRKNCAVGSFGTISEPDGLSSRIIYQMKAEIDIQNWVNFYENPTDTNWHIKAWTWNCILTPVPIRNFSIGRFQEYGLVVIMVIYPDTPSISLHGLMHDSMPST